jgi:hypothetical protein
MPLLQRVKLPNRNNAAVVEAHTVSTYYLVAVLPKRDRSQITIAFSIVDGPLHGWSPRTVRYWTDPLLCALLFQSIGRSVNRSASIESIMKTISRCAQSIYAARSDHAQLT